MGREFISFIIVRTGLQGCSGECNGAVAPKSKSPPPSPPPRVSHDQLDSISHLQSS